MSSNIRIDRICELCGKSFVAKTTVTRFCSHTCNSRWGKIRVRELKVKVSNNQTLELAQKPLNDLKEKDYLSLAEAGKLLGISRMTLHRQIKAGRVKIKRFGRRVIVSKKQLEQIFR
jgi:excisionase family DNA binding protein